MKSVYPQRGVKAYFDEDEVSFSVAAVLAKEGRALPPPGWAGVQRQEGRGCLAGGQDAMAEQNVDGFLEESGEGHHFLSAHIASCHRIPKVLGHDHGVP